MAEHGQAIQTGTNTSTGSWILGTTVLVQTAFDADAAGFCTGVLVGPRHVLTAAHCCAEAGATTVFFYGTSSTGESPGSGIGVSAVAMRPGVAPSSDCLAAPNDGDFEDAQGAYADLAVLTLASAAPSALGLVFPAFPIDPAYPGAGATGLGAGAGDHDDVPNDTFRIRHRLDAFWSDGIGDGKLLTETYFTSHGDSGGGFFKFDFGAGRPVLHGVYSGATYRLGSGYHSQYTSVAYHRAFILDAMSYTGPFQTTSGQLRVGATPLGVFYDLLHPLDFRTCALRCAQAGAGCVGYNHEVVPSGRCTLLATKGSAGVTTSPSWTSGVRRP